MTNNTLTMNQASGPNTQTAGFGNPRPNNPQKKFVPSDTESEDHSNLQEFLEHYGNLSM